MWNRDFCRQWKAGNFVNHSKKLFLSHCESWLALWQECLTVFWKFEFILSQRNYSFLVLVCIISLESSNWGTYSSTDDKSCSAQEPTSYNFDKIYVKITSKSTWIWIITLSLVHVGNWLVLFCGLNCRKTYVCKCRL